MAKCLDINQPFQDALQIIKEADIIDKNKIKDNKVRKTAITAAIDQILEAYLIFDKIKEDLDIRSINEKYFHAALAGS